MKINFKRSKKTLLLTILLVLIVGITVVAISVTVLFDHNNGASSSAQLIKNGTAMSGVYHGKTSAELLKELKKQQIRVTDRINSQIKFQSGKAGTIGSWIVENSATNSVTVQCTVMLKGASIAVSAPIKPGQHIENIMLNTPLDSGTYSVTVSVKYYDPKTSDLLGQAEYQNVRMVVL